MAFKRVPRVQKHQNNRQGRRERGLVQDLDAAQRVAERYGMLDPLGRIDAGRSSEIADLISGRQRMVDQASQRDPAEERLRAMMEGGLGGLTAEENTALREGAQSEVDRNFASQLRALAGYSGQRGLAGLSQAGINDLSANRLDAQRNLERDILIKNIDIQNERRKAYGDYLDALVSGEFDRASKARADLEQLTVSARNDELQRELYNQEQGRREADLRSSALFGTAGILANRRNTARALQLEAQRIRTASQATPANTITLLGGGSSTGESAGI